MSDLYDEAKANKEFMDWLRSYDSTWDCLPSGMIEDYYEAFCAGRKLGSRRPQNAYVAVVKAYKPDIWWPGY